MFWNYFLLALRHIRKHRAYASINVLGLALGMACCMLIGVWIRYEFGYDRFHDLGGRLFKAWSETVYADGRQERFGGSYYPLAGLLNAGCPGVERAVRVAEGRNVLIGHGEKRFSDNRVGYVDEAFLDLFTFPLIKGDKENVLIEKFSIVLSATMARKYFGDEDPMGKVLNVGNEYDVQVTGVMEDMPRQSTIRYDCLMPFLLSLGPDASEPDHWGGNPFSTYVLVEERADPEESCRNVTQAVLQQVPLPEGMDVSFHLQAVSRMHLTNLEGGGLISSIRIFSAIALFVLLIACINYMNLTTARAMSRAGEVGLRKVVGARRSDLIRQFFGESVLITLITLVIAFLLVIATLPLMSDIVGRPLSIRQLVEPAAILGFILLAMVTGLVSGSYPALFLSSLRPRQILQGGVQAGPRSARLRKFLVVAQFSIAIVLIIDTNVVFRQLRYIGTRDLGFEKKNLASVNLMGKQRRTYEALKTALLNYPQIVSVTRSLQHPAHIGSSIQNLDWEGKNPQETLSMNFEFVDYDYFQTFGMQMIQGRAFDDERANDLMDGYVINERAAELMGLENPVGVGVSAFGESGRIIGVVKDFHFQPLTHEIQPFIIGGRPDWSKNRMFVRFRPGMDAEAIRIIQQVLKAYDPDFPGNVRLFEDDVMRWNYESEQVLRRIAGYLTVIAVIIASLGLLGLASYLAAKRIKEIGIRKVLGASEASVVVMLSRVLSRWVLVSNFVAWPVAYFIAKNFLAPYAYRVRLGLDVFIVSSLTAFLIALVTVSVQAIKAAVADPVDSLRYE